MTPRARKLARWLLLPPALFALACALLAPAEAGRTPTTASAPATRRAPQEGQERRKSEPPSDSVVWGRAVYDDTNRPVRRARVMLSGEGGRHEYNALTDARGQFAIAGVRAGAYYAYLDVPGVLSPIVFVSLGELRASGGPGMPDIGEGRAFFDLVEVDGKKNVEVTVHARRGASIAGLVTYADGDPAVNVAVNLMRRDAAGRLQSFLTGMNLASLSSLSTDDRGMFRLAGLPPGEYVVGVSESVDHTPGGGRGRGDNIRETLEGMVAQQFLMTFYPSATSPKEATVVKVAAGEERTGVDIRIPERELRIVSGVARSRRDKRPLAGAQVTIERRDDPLDSAGAGPLYDTGGRTSTRMLSDAEGRWEFVEIPDGPYTINVKPAEEYEPGTATAAVMNSNTSNTSAYSGNMNGDYRPPRRKRGYAPARRDVEVSGGDLSDVIIEVGDGGHVSGGITAEGGESNFYAHVSLLRVPDGGNRPTLGDVRSAEVNGGPFSLEGLPAGRFFLQATTYENEGSLYVKSITWNGRDLLREPLELGEGASVEGVQIVFARNPATLRVTTVRAGERKPALNALAILLPADASEWSVFSARRLSCMTSDEGFCSIKAPPGEYHVVGLPRKIPLGAIEAEVRRRAATAPRVSLRAGETKEFEVVVPDK